MARPLPRLKSWATPAELQQVFADLYHPSSEPASICQLEAISLINVWLLRSPHCPHFVESTASILSLLILPSPSQVHLRLALGASLTRLVNTLLDPLQTTYYAQPLVKLAAQINLPLWFVDLRHQATHEDLPSLPALRDAAHHALDYLYTQYWVPAIASLDSTTKEAEEVQDMERLVEMLGEWKQVVKDGIKDASKPAARKIALENLEKKLREWDDEAIATALIKSGLLIPSARKKRPTPASPLLPTSVSQLWEQLLKILPSLRANLVTQLSEAILTSPPSTTSQDDEERIRITKQAWLLYLDPKAALRLPPTTFPLKTVEALSFSHPSLSLELQPLLSLLQEATPDKSMEMDIDSSLSEMARREADFERMLSGIPTLTSVTTSSESQAEGLNEDGNSAERNKSLGWRKVENWKPVPIGWIRGEQSLTLKSLTA